MKTSSFGESNAGLIRDINEDVYFADDKLGLYIVCDGMCGLDNGQVAARVAVDTVANHVRSHRRELAQLGRDEFALREFAKAAIREANDEIRFLASKTVYFRGMQTTITMLLLHETTAVIANCGDSRTYRVTAELELLTDDHTLTADVQRRSPDRIGDEELSQFSSVPTRRLGQVDAEADIRTLKLRDGDRFLLCSDGLSRYVDQHSCPPWLDDPQECAIQLVDFAIDSGGRDNATAVVVDIESESNSEFAKTALKSLTLV